MRLAVVILAAGKGKRMLSDLPKVLHPLGGKSLLAHVLDTAKAVSASQRIVVYGHGGEQVCRSFDKETDIIWVEQAEQLGTGHALAQALPLLGDVDAVLVLYGDVPLLQADTLQALLTAVEAGQVGLLTADLEDPSGYGRILRDQDGMVQRIVEHQDATAEELAIQEINTGILAIPLEPLDRWIEQLQPANAQGEYYLTDIIAMAVAEGIVVNANKAADPIEIQGINDRVQLAALERVYQARQAEHLMRNGVTLRDPARIDIRGQLTAGRDVVIDTDVVFEGEVHLGDRVQIGPFSYLRDAVIGNDSQIQAHCHIDGIKTAANVQIGPYARLRPGAYLAEQARVGNFVEVKNAVIGQGSKVNHLTYIGDAEIGSDVNIGAGTITCNYDGANKHKTIIEDEVFIGSNSALVAPVRIGKGATVGAGSTIGRDVPERNLALTRAPQRQRKDWQRPVKKK